MTALLAANRLPPELVEAAAQLQNGTAAAALAEQCVLGSILTNPANLDKLAGRLTSEQFFFDAHQRIFAMASRLYEAGTPLDVVVVAEQLAIAGDEAATGGLAYLGQIVAETPGDAALMTHAGLVAMNHARRQAVAALADGAGQLVNGELSQALADIQSRLDLVREPLHHRGGPAGLVDAPTALLECLTWLDKQLNGDIPTLLSTGLRDLDDKLGGGLGDGELVIVAGRPSMGKTSLALGVALNVAREFGGAGSVAVFSMEMPRRELMQRLISTAGGVEFSQLRNPEVLDDDAWSRVSAAVGTLQSTGLHIDDGGVQTVASIAQSVRRLAREKPLRLVVIDYLQLLTSNSSCDVREQQVAAMSRQLKQLARELSVPIVVLSQLSRKVEERPEKRPLMSDMRESGAIEQDADVILLMYREEYYRPDAQDKEVAEVIVGKSRNGQRNVTARLRWRGEIQRFEDFDSVSVSAAEKTSSTNGWRG